jgi:Septum formation
MTGIDRRPWGGWISSALLGLALAGAVGGCGSFWIGPKPSPSVAASSPAASPTATPKPQYQAPGDLAAGDCFDPIRDREDQSLLAAIIRRCDEPHLMESIGVATLPYPASAPFPDSSTLDQQSEALCRTEFATYVGIELNDSQLQASYYEPTERTWAGGDRIVLCVVEANEVSPLTKSVKDSRI